MAELLEGVLAFGPLVDWMRSDGVTQKVLAEAVGVTQQSVSGWVNRKSRPKSERARISIELLSGGLVHRDLWKNAKEREPVVVKPLGKTGTEAH